MSDFYVDDDFNADEAYREADEAYWQEQYEWDAYDEFVADEYELEIENAWQAREIQRLRDALAAAAPPF